MRKEGTDFVEVLHLYKVCLHLHFSLDGLRILVVYFLRQLSCGCRRLGIVILMKYYYACAIDGFFIKLLVVVVIICSLGLTRGCVLLT